MYLIRSQRTTADGLLHGVTARKQVARDALALRPGAAGRKDQVPFPGTIAKLQEK